MARSGVTAERLTGAAADLADEIGLPNVTVSAVARRFGVRPAALYAHIQDLRDLRLRVAELALTELADRAAAALAGRAGKEALVACANTYRDYAKAHPGRYAATRVAMEPDTPAGRAAVRHSAMMRTILRGYRLPEPDQTDAIRMLGGMFHGFVDLEAAGGFRHHPREADASWARILDALDAALRNWPAA
ncbi:transcriptional regulator [Sphaerisporangium rufum]|uniref:Transcriptional regulator n=1 Tax=Sphaerisporangium rufum TaxID=1381558 RepID=A0A919RD58_9ACTN|nr:TetR-like C-terminal domain-containing protein [Sphaerisporangium rufum]GII81800.1 transcriptional regulator [Sphaerisporangium rufum]